MLSQPDVVPSTDRDPASGPEIARMMPSGVKNWVRRIIEKQATLQDLPGGVLGWLETKGAVKESSRRGEEGRLVWTRAGQSAVTQVHNRMKGHN